MPESTPQDPNRSSSSKDQDRPFDLEGIVMIPEASDPGMSLGAAKRTRRLVEEGLIPDLRAERAQRRHGTPDAPKK